MYKAITIPTGKEGFKAGDICKRIKESVVFDEKVGFVMIATTDKTFPNPDWQSQYLAITSDEEVKEGDWCIAYQTILSNNNQSHYIIQSFTDIVEFTSGKIITSGRYDTIECKKIIASIHPSINNISLSDLKWWAQNGCPKMVELKMEECVPAQGDYTGNFSRLPYLRLKLIDGCVVFVREVQHTIYTHPEENAPRLKSISDLIDEMIVMVDAKNNVEKAKYDKCIKPNCKCIEIEMEKQGTENIKNYPCLADRSCDIESVKTTAIKEQEQSDVDKTAESKFPYFDKNDFHGGGAKHDIEISNQKVEQRRRDFKEGASWQQSNPSVTSMSAEEIAIEFAEWIRKNCMYGHYNTWNNMHDMKSYHTTQLYQLFLTQYKQK